MANNPIDPNEPHEFVLSLIAAEILTRKGALGPLARVFATSPKSKISANNTVIKSNKDDKKGR